MVLRTERISIDRIDIKRLYQNAHNKKNQADAWFFLLCTTVSTHSIRIQILALFAYSALFLYSPDSMGSNLYGFMVFFSNIAHVALFVANGARQFPRRYVKGETVLFCTLCDSF